MFRVTQPDPETAFGALVRERRSLKQWTQDLLRRRLLDTYGIDLSKTAMSRLEQGERPIRLNEVYALAQLLDIDLRTFGRAPSRSEAEEADAVFIEATARLGAVERELEMASNAAAAAQAAYEETRMRVQVLQQEHARLMTERMNLQHHLSEIADARRRFELEKADGE